MYIYTAVAIDERLYVYILTYILYIRYGMASMYGMGSMYGMACKRRYTNKGAGYGTDLVYRSVLP